MLLFGGKLSDRVGRRFVLLLGLIGISFSHLLFAFSSSFVLLLLSRVLSGAFSATVSTSLAVIGDVTERKDRSRFMGFIGAAFGLGFILGPVLGGVLLLLGDQMGISPSWEKHFVALFAALLTLCNFVFAFFYLEESLPKPLRKGLIEKKKYETSLKVKQFFSFASIFFRFKFKEFLNSIFLFMLVFFLFSIAMAHMETCLFLFVEDELNWGLKEASFSFAYVGLIMSLTQGVFLKKILFLGERNLLWFGLILASLGFFGIGLSKGVLELWIWVTFIGVGSALIQSTLRGIVSLLTEKDKQGQNMGWLHSLSALGRTLGPLLGGFLYKDFGSSSPFYVASGLTFIALCVSLSLSRQTPRSQ